MENLKDQHLFLRKISNSDECAFAVVFDHYKDFVYSFAYKLLRCESSAEELVQDVFLKLWVNRHELVDVVNFGAYLHVLVRNYAFNMLRNAALRTQKEQKLQYTLARYDTSTESLVNYREVSKIFDEALENLSEQQRHIYTLCHMDGLKYEEAADQLKVSPHTVHYHMKHALKKIRLHCIKKGIIYFYLFMFCLPPN